MPVQPPQAFAQHHGLQLVPIGGLPIAVIDRAASAELMLKLARSPRPADWVPPVMTSANGQVISLCARQPGAAELFLAADLIHADGMPLVFASRWTGQHALPERVATTDLFHDVAARAEQTGASFYLLGAEKDQIAQAARRVREKYPRLNVVGYRDGYLNAEEEEAAILEINALAPDILWIGMGVPREQNFALRHKARLHRVGVIKTSGGLFDFLSGKNSRAPVWMQASGLEWLYRMALEPRRLSMRYLTSNPHALMLLLRGVRLKTDPQRDRLAG